MSTTQTSVIPICERCGKAIEGIVWWRGGMRSSNPKVGPYCTRCRPWNAVSWDVPFNELTGGRTG